MRMSQAFPSKFLKAADLNNQRYTLTIARVDMESINDNEAPKPVLYFQGADKGMVLNQTNGMMIASLYGDDSDNWAGRGVELYTAIVPFNGQNVPAIRVMAPAGSPPAPLNGPLPASPAPNQAPAPQFQNPSAFAGQPEPEQAGDDPSDPIPF